MPPEEDTDSTTYKIVSEVGKEFEIDNYETMETEELDKIKPAENGKHFALESFGPVNAETELMEDDSKTDTLVN